MDNGATDAAAAPVHESADSVVLEEEIDPNYVPSESEVVEYAKWLGMDLEKDKDLFWIAREGLMAPLPKDWKPCRTKDTDDIYYFNFSSGESTWDHPCDGYYKRLYEEEKKKKEIEMKESNDQKRSKAKQDVEQLLGKSEKKKKKKRGSEIPSPLRSSAESIGSLEKAPLPSLLQRNPLPNIRLSGSTNSLSQSDNDVDVASSDPGILRNQVVKTPSPLSIADGKANTLRPLSSDGAKRDEKGCKPTLPQKSVLGEGSYDSKVASDVPLPIKKSTSPAPSAALGPIEKTRARSRSSSPVSALRGEVAASGIYHLDSDAAAIAQQKPSVDDKASKDSENEYLPNLRSSLVSPIPEGIASIRADAANSALESVRSTKYGPNVEVSASDERKIMELQSEIDSLAKDNSSLKRVIKDLEGRNANLESSLARAKNESASWEDWFEKSHNDWKAKVTAIESERDRIDDERRQLKLQLMNFELHADRNENRKNDLRTDSSEITALLQQIDALQGEIKMLNNQLRQSREDLQKCRDDFLNLKTKESELNDRCCELEVVREKLQAQLADSAILQVPPPVASLEQSPDMSSLRRERDSLAREVDTLKAKLKEAENSRDLKTESLTSLELSMQRRYDILSEEKSALLGKVEALTRQGSISNTNLDSAMNELRDSKNEIKEMTAKVTLIEEELSRSVAKEKAQEKEIARLSALIESCRQPEGQPRSDEDQHKDQILQQRISELESERISLFSQISRKGTELQHAKDELNSLAEHVEARRQLEQDKKILLEEKCSLESSLRAQQQIEFHLRSEYESLLRQNQENSQKLIVLQTSESNLERDLAEERSSNAQKDKKIRGYQEELLHLQRRVTELNQAAVSHQDIIPTSNSTDTSELVARLQTNMKQKEMDIKFLRDEVTRLSDMNASQVSSAAQLKSENAQSILSLGLAEKRASDCAMNFRAQKNGIDGDFALRESLSSLSRDMNDMQRSNSKLELDLHNAIQKKSQLEGELETNRLINERLKEENTSLQSKWMAAENKALEISHQGSRSVSEKEIEVEKLRVQLAASEQVQFEQRNSLVEAQNEKVMIESKCVQLKLERDQLCKKIKTLEQQLEAEGDTKVKLGGDLSESYRTMERDVEELREKNRRLEDEVCKLQSNLRIQDALEKKQSNGPEGTTVNVDAIACEHPEKVETEVSKRNSTIVQNISSLLNLGVPSTGGGHLIELSILVGRQQGAMIRLEEQLRAAEARIASISSSSGPGVNALNDQRWRTTTGENSQSTESQSLIPTQQEGHCSDSSLNYGRDLRQMVGRQSSRTVKFKQTQNDAGRLESLAAPLQERLMEAIKNSGLQTLAKLKYFTSTTSDQLKVMAARQLVLCEMRNQSKRESKLLREMQMISSSAKRMIKSDQACIRNMKTMWKNRINSAELTAMKINRATNQLNAQVDLLRCLNSFVSSRQRKIDSFDQMINYFDQLIGGDEGEVSSSKLKPTGAPMGKIHSDSNIDELLRTVERKRDGLASDLKALLLSVEDTGKQVNGGYNSKYTEASEQNDDMKGIKGAPLLGTDFDFDDAAKGVSIGRNLSASRVVTQGHDSSTVPKIRPTSSANSKCAPLEQFSLDPRHRTQILHDQVNRYLAKNNYSQQVCEKHAGWLSSLHKELENFSHGSSRDINGYNSIHPNAVFDCVTHIKL